MSGGVYRFVEHTIRHVPAGGSVWEAFCTAHGCEADSGHQDEQATAQDWALRHSGRTGHRLFRRVVTDHAEVSR